MKFQIIFSGTFEIEKIQYFLTTNSEFRSQFSDCAGRDVSVGAARDANANRVTQNFNCQCCFWRLSWLEKI